MTTRRDGKAPVAGDGNVPLAVVGCDFRVASTHWRSVVQLSDPERRDLAASLSRSAGARGLVVLETCNRIEWILDADRPAWVAELARGEMLRRWRASGLSSGVLPTPYRFVGDDAVRHLVRVALGLESFVVGEREIAGQFNRALAAARGIGVSSSHLNALQTTVGRVGKRVQRLTRFGTASRGVHGLAGDVLRQELAGRGGPPWRVAVVGMGEIGRKAADLLASDPQIEVVAVNRTIPHERRGQWIPLEQARGSLLAGCDAVIVSTGSRSPVLGFEDLAVDDQSPVVVIDLGTPSQVSWQGAEQMDTRLLGLDDLLVECVRPRDDTDLDVVLDLVDDAVQEFRVVCHKRSVGRLLQTTQDRYDLLAYRDLPRLLRDGLEGADEAAVRGVEASVRSAIRSYTNEIIEEIERSST